MLKHFLSAGMTVVAVTGGADSQFPALYILVITVSSILMPLASSLLITILASLLYLANIVWLNQQAPAAQIGIRLMLGGAGMLVFIIGLVFLVGVSFETPLIMAFLSRLGVVTAKQMLAETAKVTPHPVSRIILTHSDGDHVNGISGFYYFFYDWQITTLTLSVPLWQTNSQAASIAINGRLATFADLMSLLMCFFVLLLSFAEIDAIRFKKMAESMKEAFGVQICFIPHPGNACRGRFGLGAAAAFHVHADHRRNGLFRCGLPAASTRRG